MHRKIVKHHALSTRETIAMMAARPHLCELASTFAMPFLSVQTLEARRIVHAKHQQPPFHDVYLSVACVPSRVVIIGAVGLACRPVPRQWPDFQLHTVQRGRPDDGLKSTINSLVQQ